MTFVPRPAYPVALWPQPPLPGAEALVVITLTPYLLTDGSVEYLGPADPVPAGALVATERDDGTDQEEVVEPAVAGGRVITMNGSGELFFN